jgi:hypothetical protein
MTVLRDSHAVAQSKRSLAGVRNAELTLKTAHHEIRDPEVLQRRSELGVLKRTGRVLLDDDVA